MENKANKANKSIRIVELEQNVDLRKVVAKSKFLNLVKEHYELRSGDAICYTNVRNTRFRLVMNIGDTMFMMVPEIDEASQTSVYLKVSESLANLAGTDSIILDFKELAEKTKLRVKQRKTKLNLV